MTKQILKLVLFLFIGTQLFAQNGEKNKCWSIDYETWNTTGQPSLYINCGNDPAFNAGEELSIEVWARAFTFAENRKMMGKLEYREPIDNGYVLGFENLHVYAEYFNPSLQQVPRPGDGPMPADSSLVHIVTTYSVSSGKIKNYVNGMLAGETTMFPSTAIQPNDQPFIIGNAPWDMLSYQFYGEMDEVRIWNVALSQEEIYSRMHIQLKGDELGLVAYYNFNAAVDSTVPDAGPNNFNGVLANSIHESTEWAISSAPVGDEVMGEMIDIEAAWYRNAENYHKILSDHGILLISDIQELEFRKYLVLGQNGEEGVVADLAPEDAPADFIRTNRQWYVNAAGNVGGSMTITLEDAGVGTDFPADDDINQYALLYRKEESQDFRAVARPSTPFSGIFQINDMSFQDGFYALGHASEEFPILGWDAIPENYFPNLSMAPNPVNGSLYIKGAPLNTNISIFQLNGSRVQQLNSMNANQSIDLSHLEPGIYFIEFENDGNRITKKLIKN